MKSDYGIDLMGLEKYHKAWVPTGAAVLFGIIMAIKIKKILFALATVYAAAFVTKVFAGIWKIVAGYNCPHKPIFVKEIKYVKPYYDHFDEYERRYNDDGEIDGFSDNFSKVHEKRFKSSGKRRGKSSISIK